MPPFPALLAASAEDHYEFGFLAIEQGCSGSKYHSPTPLIVKHLVLDPVWGFQTIGCDERYFGTLATAWLCGTCSDNVALYLQLLRKHDGEPDWPIRREFGNLVRVVGDAAWQAHKHHERDEERIQP